MENINNTEAKARVTVPQGKPPTRLQKGAPVALQLDQIVVNNYNANPYASCNEPNSSRCAIPLLSPLIVSPPPMSVAEEKTLPWSSNNEQGSNGKQGAPAVPVPGGWQHPAVGPLTDASSLFTFFQSQCVL